jgi:hypothetical protein
MFDTFAGLPLHALINHAVVVLLPVMAALTIVVAVRKSLRERFMWWVVGANTAMFLVTLVTKESGQALQKSLGGQVAQDHAALGNVLPWFALFLALASAGSAVTARNKALGPIAAVVSIVAAVAAVIWTVRTGDAGARAVWGS